MRRWFTALLALLVTAQLAWAGASLCCVAELGGVEPTASSSGMAPAHDDAATDADTLCETAGHCHCHHGGCAAPLAEAPLPAAAGRPAPEAAPPARLKSHIPRGLERPDWQRA